jgi:hypothetical protein
MVQSFPHRVRSEGPGSSAARCVPDQPQVRFLGYQTEYPFKRLATSQQYPYLWQDSMRPREAFVAAGVLCVCMGTSLPANADDKPGICNIKPADLLATFRYAASGQALAGNPLGIPAGAFAYVGTATGITANQSGNNIVGTWSTTFAQNDSSGRPTTHTVPGTFTVSTIDCTGVISLGIQWGWSSAPCSSITQTNSVQYQPCHV